MVPEVRTGAIGGVVSEARRAICPRGRPSAAAVHYWCKPLEHQCSDRFLCAPAAFSTAFSTGFCGKVTSAGTSIALMRYHDSVELWCHLVAFVFPQKQPVPRRGLRSAVVLE